MNVNFNYTNYYLLIINYYIIIITKSHYNYSSVAFMELSLLNLFILIVFCEILTLVKFGENFTKSELGKSIPNFLLKHVITSIKHFSFSRKSILDVQVLWSHQMPKHETRNTFYWITWKVNTVCQWNLASLCYITKEKNLWKNSTKTASRKLVPGIFFVCKELSTTSVGKWNFRSNLHISDTH